MRLRKHTSFECKTRSHESDYQDGAEYEGQGFAGSWARRSGNLAGDARPLIYHGRPMRSRQSTIDKVEIRALVETGCAEFCEVWPKQYCRQYHISHVGPPFNVSEKTVKYSGAKLLSIALTLFGPGPAGQASDKAFIRQVLYNNLIGDETSGVGALTTQLRLEQMADHLIRPESQPPISLSMSR